MSWNEPDNFIDSQISRQNQILSQKFKLEVWQKYYII